LRRLLPCLLASALISGAASAETPKIILAPYEQALRYFDQGECEKGQKIVMPTGNPKAGEEMVMTDAGQCFLRAAKKAKTEAEAQQFREIGAGWIILAATRGLRNAQEEAVKLYLDGSVFYYDPYEAGKWYLVWMRNRSQIQFGQVEFDPDILKRMNNSFTAEQWAEAKARAEKFVPVISPEIPRAP
jgi:hypothetical protein